MAISRHLKSSLVGPFKFIGPSTPLAGYCPPPLSAPGHPGASNYVQFVDLITTSSKIN